MNRRRFLQNAAVASAGVKYLSVPTKGMADTVLPEPSPSTAQPLPDIEGHTLVAEFKIETTTWKVYEDLRTREGVLTFISSRGGSRVLRKSAEATFADANPPHLGLSMDEIGLAGADLLADRLLASGGDPDPDHVKAAAPPQGSFTPPATPGAPPGGGNPRTRWTTFVGTKEAFDVAPVYYGGNTRTYHPVQTATELRTAVAQGKVFDGLLGGWMPAVRKVMPVSDAAYYEVVVFGDVEAPDKFIVQTWHRTARIENGKMTRAIYGHSYPAFPPARTDPRAEEFYRALLIFHDYWEKQLRDMSPASLPDVWVDMSKHAFAKELMIRPGGVYPKYGAVDRDYFGSEYDGFQDIFTMAVYTQLEWGRFETARQFIDNYFTDFVDAKGMVNMRGPETAQFGLTLSLLARYFNYTRDSALMLKHASKIRATATLLAELHDEALRLPEDNPGHGLIHGWSESDACLANDPSVWWKPYFANSAFAVRGWKDIARVWSSLPRVKASAHMVAEIQDWLKRSQVLREAMVASIEKNIKHEMNPPYIGPLPGAKLTFRESMAQERPSPQQWPHRPYTELLQADVLPPKLANLTIDCMRAYGATTIGVVANVGVARAGSRAILGFISYGYAQMLLRLDRVEEFLLFLYSHRYHDHTRGSWTAGEVSGINGGTATFCIPAQQTIPLLVRWMLVLEDSDNDVLYLGKGIPRSWLASEQEIRIGQAPTRWGPVNFSLSAKPQNKTVVGNVALSHPGEPKELQVKLRLPNQQSMNSVTVNGIQARVQGTHNDTVIIQTENSARFEIIAKVG